MRPALLGYKTQIMLCLR